MKNVDFLSMQIPTQDQSVALSSFDSQTLWNEIARRKREEEKARLAADAIRVARRLADVIANGTVTENQLALIEHALGGLNL